MNDGTFWMWVLMCLHCKAHAQLLFSWTSRRLNSRNLEHVTSVCIKLSVGILSLYDTSMLVWHPYIIQAVFKKRPNFCYKDFTLQHFKHCPLQSSSLYWRYTVPTVSSVVGMLPGTHLLWWRAVLLSHFPEPPRVKQNELFKKRANQQRGRTTATERT
jgi:hypothetical protein